MFDKQFNNLNLLIIKQLLSSRKGSQMRVDKLFISKAFKNYLTKKYKLNGRYKSCAQFLLDHNKNIITERFFNEINYSLIDKNEFYLKINSGRRIKYFDKNMNENTLSGEPFLSIKFRRIDMVKSNN